MTHKDNPETAAEYFGVDGGEGKYLAHAIRKIEEEILKKHERHYHILTNVPVQRAKAFSLFSKKDCTIHLPSGTGKDEKAIRLALGHELGHLIFNFDKLGNVKQLDSNEFASEEEEVFAWIFAYYLIWQKSKHHEHSTRAQEFVYEDVELKRAVTNAVKEATSQTSNIYFSVAKKLGFPLS